MKKLCITCMMIILAITFAIIYVFNNGSEIGIEDMEYRTDTEPIRNNFPDFYDISLAYWKSGVYGKPGLGPSDTWLKGFVLISEQFSDDIKSMYEWTETEIVFEEGMTPSITGFDNFKWYYSNNFSENARENRFMGNFFLDTENNVLYFDLSTY